MVAVNPFFYGLFLVKVRPIVLPQAVSIANVQEVFNGFGYCNKPLTRNEGFFWSSPRPEWKFLLATSLSLIVGTWISAKGLFSSDFVGMGWKYTLYSWGYILTWFIICLMTKLFLYMLVKKARV